MKKRGGTNHRQFIHSSLNGKITISGNPDVDIPPVPLTRIREKDKWRAPMLRVSEPIKKPMDTEEVTRQPSDASALECGAAEDHTSDRDPFAGPHQQQVAGYFLLHGDVSDAIAVVPVGAAWGAHGLQGIRCAVDGVGFECLAAGFTTP